MEKSDDSHDGSPGQLITPSVPGGEREYAGHIAKSNESADYKYCCIFHTTLVKECHER
jgi:hypothetical protein